MENLIIETLRNNGFKEKQDGTWINKGGTVFNSAKEAYNSIQEKYCDKRRMSQTEMVIQYLATTHDGEL